MKPEEFDKQFLAWLDTQVQGHRRQVSGVAEADEGTASCDDRARQHDEVIKLAPEAHRDCIRTSSKQAASTNCWRSVSWPRTTKPRAMKALATVLRSRRPQSGNAEEAGQACRKKPASTQEAVKTLERLDLHLPDGRRAASQAWGSVYGAGTLRMAPSANIRAVVASKPLDQAASHFNLARALHERETDGGSEGAVCCSLWKPRRVQARAEAVARTVALKNP